MVLAIVFGVLAVLSLALMAWQTIAASRFPLHQRADELSYVPPVLILKPLKGCDEHTADCLRSWMRQEYKGAVTILFGTAEASDPARAVVLDLMREFPGVNARIVLTPLSLGPNAKISNVAQLYREAGALAADTIVCISDADVRVPLDFLAHAVSPFSQSKVGVVTAFYRFANPQNVAMQVEAMAVNADFWSQVLQSNTMKPQGFALGAVMMARPSDLAAIGGFEELAHYLADDYQLGNRIARLGRSVELARVVVECWDGLMTFQQVWAHQVRWARTIRVSQPLPYFFSILNNVTLWCSLFGLVAAFQGIYRVAPGYPWHFESLWVAGCLGVSAVGLLARVVTARYLVERLARKPVPWPTAALILAKDVMQFGVWATAFLGNTVTWRGRSFSLAKDGRLIPVDGAK